MRDLQTGGLTVLLAEDNPVNQTLTRALLEQLGHCVLTVADGSQALDLVKQQKVDVLLLDVMMPAMDGLAATRAIRSLEQTESRVRTPIFGFSADAMSHQVAEQLEAGLDGHLQKPIQVEALFSLLETMDGQRSG